MRVAIVHDWLVVNAGAEKVLEQMLKVFPDADLFATVDFLPEEERGVILHKKVHTTFIQKLPYAKTKYRHYLPLMPLAIEQLDLSAYDLVISSSHAVAKGVLTGPHQRHVCMCYSPMRYAWDLQHQYLRESGLDKGLKGWVVRYLLHRLRLWDYRSAQNVDEFIAISQFIQKRIWKAYRRESTVIYPPVDLERFSLCEQKEGFYVTASRMVPYKRIDLIVEAFAKMPDKKLVVIGDGPEMNKVRAKVGDNVEIMGYQPFEVLKDHLQKAKAFVFAAEEDFGIAPLEAQACGTPVIAFGKGGALETVLTNITNDPTGRLFAEQTVASLCQTVIDFDKSENLIRPEDCRKNAERFAIQQFQSQFETFVRETLQ